MSSISESGGEKRIGQRVTKRDRPVHDTCVCAQQTGHTAGDGLRSRGLDHCSSDLLFSLIGGREVIGTVVQSEAFGQRTFVTTDGHVDAASRRRGAGTV